MSLINCPECGTEVSSTAVVCPKCGHPFASPVVERKVIVAEPRREEAFPKWVFIPLIIIGAVILLVVFMMFRNDDTANQKNINVNIHSPNQQERTSTTTIPSSSAPSTVVVPSTSTAPQTIETPSSVTTVPPSTTTSVIETAPDKSVVNIEAKILNKTGSALPVTKEKFYLLDKDLESILSQANINDEGQGLINAFGLSVVNPGKYGETNKKALAAINPHIVYSTTTDSSGKAELKDVKPKNYYLFGITKTKNGFAVWSSPVVINPGQNSLMLDPVSPTEILDNNQ